MELTVRYPQIDYEKCFPNWAPNLEFAMFMNAFSITPVFLEPYIIKVFADARKLLDPVRDEQLTKEVDWFVAQESQHYRQHAKFNRIFQTPRFPKVEELGKGFGADLDGFRKNRSLLFNLSYTEGFEAAGGVFYRIWFEKLGKYRFGAREEALLIYDWHFAEEFEHREVAYKLYMALAVRGNIFRKIWYAYFYRIYGVLAMLGHSGKYSDAVRQHLLETYRAEMSPEEVEASKKREKAFGKFLFRSTIVRLLGVLSPWYNPARKPPPEGLEAVLTSFDRGGQYSSTAA